VTGFTALEVLARTALATGVLAGSAWFVGMACWAFVTTVSTYWVLDLILTGDGSMLTGRLVLLWRPGCWDQAIYGYKNTTDYK
jgi:hypothetical protein